MIAFFIIGVASSLSLNLLVVVVVAQKKRRMNHLDVFKISLAVSDIMQSGIGYPLEIYANISSKEISKLSCTVAGFSTTFLGLVSINHLMGISIERSLTVNLPWRARLWRKNRWNSLCIIIPSWVYGLVWAIFPLTGWSAYKRERGAQYRCSIDLETKETGTRTYAYSLLVFCFVLPLIVISISSFFTIRIMKKMSYSAPKIGVCQEETSIRERRESRNSIMVFVLVSAFLISWAPYASCVLVLTVSGNINGTMLTVSAVFAKTSTLYNPIIYIIFMRDFRYRCLVFFGWRKKKRESFDVGKSVLSDCKF